MSIRPFADSNLPASQGQVHPGFWQVPVGSLVEVGDQYLDRQGHVLALPLERVGRPVTPELVVLRPERRRAFR